MSLITLLLQVLVKLLYLLILVPKYGGEIWHPYECGGGGGTPGRTILSKLMCVFPTSGRWSMWDCGGDVEKGGMILDGKPACPVAPHPRCMAVGLYWC